jgi:hypothetical protein
MNECLICYDKLENENIVFLNCFHFLCRLCLTKLRQNSCPFCRANITKKDLLHGRRSRRTQRTRRDSIFNRENLRVQIRRRKYRHRFMEIDDVDGIVIVVEMLAKHAKKIKNSRKEKWNKHNSKKHK